MVTRVMIMAGGTGGHVFPALAVAECLREEGAEVLWMGTRSGLESKVVPPTGLPLDTVSIAGLRGGGALGWLLLPLRLAVAMLQSLVILMRFRPMVILGMGGFVAGPGGLVTWLLRKPLVIHEQNAVAGLTNRWLARIATRVLIAFPGALPVRLKPVLTGNPVRAAIVALAPPRQRFAGRVDRPRLLVLGGSQGARGLNNAVPAAVAALSGDRRPQVRHQAGRGRDQQVRHAYAERGVEAQVVPFIDDIAEAYGWADLVVCRAGALTIAELSAAGLGAVLVPYPHAVDDHQTRNAAFLVDAGAAILIPETGDLDRRLTEALTGLIGSDHRERLLEMAIAARGVSRPDAAIAVAHQCMELADA